MWNNARMEHGRPWNMGEIESHYSETDSCIVFCSIGVQFYFMPNGFDIFYMYFFLCVFQTFCQKCIFQKLSFIGFFILNTGLLNQRALDPQNIYMCCL